MRIAVRYDMADSKGETRRERNTRFKWPSPVAVVDDDNRYLLSIYWRMNRFKGSGFAGPLPLTPGMVTEWTETFRTPLSLDEIEVLMKLDDEFNKTYYAEYVSKKEGAGDNSTPERTYSDSGSPRR